jgi:LysR family glycine cleavage system transcriptional activator
VSRRLPPLNSLIAFETSARLGSFTRAAEEMNVTSAAVGQQVRGLEDRLNIKLFHRSLEGLTLTSEAQSALPQIRRGFDLLSQGVQTLVASQRQKRLSISAPPTFAMKWLVPRLHSFYEQCPGSDIRFDTSMGYIDVARGEVDLAIRYGNGDYEGLHSEILLGEYILPLCAPKLCKSGLKAPADLNRFTLLHMDGETSDKNWPDWPDWGKRNNLDIEKFHDGPRFTQSGMALQAAVEGQGVALCGISFALDEISVGKLVAPFDTNCAIKTDNNYDLVYPKTNSLTDAQIEFLEWVKKEASTTRQLTGSYLKIDY